MIPGQGTKIPHDMEQPSPDVTTAEPTCASTRGSVHHCGRLDTTKQINNKKSFLTIKRERERINNSVQQGHRIPKPTHKYNHISIY